MKQAVVLLSGGLDSTTCLYEAISSCSEVIAISFDYGQKHKLELERASFICEKNKVCHLIQRIDTSIYEKANSSLTNSNLKVPKNSLTTNEIPNTYVPARNILFLSFALSVAESYSYDFIYIGVNALDYSGYPDCRPEFINHFQSVINIGTKKGIENNPIQIKTPLLNLTKKEIIQKAIKLNVPIKLTISCYEPIQDKACGECDACLLRKKGFKEAQIEDPTNYYI